jgi:hypothetical protein
MYIQLVIFLISSVSMAVPSIFGEDSRKEILDGPYGAFAPKTGLLIHSSRLFTGKHAIQPLGRTLQTAFNKDFCPEVSFIDQISNGFCTAFLIAPDIAMTAGHCFQSANVEKSFLRLEKSSKDLDKESSLILTSVSSNDTPEKKCHSTRMILGLDLERSNANVFSKEEVYSCQEILFYDSTMDIAVFRIDSRYEDFKDPWRVEKGDWLGKDIFSLGYPMGLPLKSSDDAKIKRIDGNYLFADLDMFYINSGSPVFDLHSKSLLGIYIWGDANYMFDPDRDCYKEVFCEGECAYAKILSLEAILPKLPSDIIKLLTQ